VQKFAPSIKILTLYNADRPKNTSSFNNYEIILTSYGTLISDITFLQHYTFNYVFLDESQNIKNIESQRYQAARLLKSRNKIAITGTPVENNTFDLYAQLSFACPGLLGNKQHFKDIYSTPIDTFKVKRRSIELQKKIAPFILRRTKAEVATELPDKTEMICYCPMGEEQRKVYIDCEKELRDFLTDITNEEISKNSMHVLRGLTRLRQICNSPQLLKDEKLQGDGSAKIELLMDQIETKSPQHKILIFSQFVGMLNLIQKELEARNIPYEFLAGHTRNRESVVHNFQTNKNIRVFLISLKAGGTGLNLTAADYVYIVDPWWNPAVENQAIDRSYRIGQKKNVVAVRLITPGTIEEKIVKLQNTKKELSDKLIKTATSYLNGISKTELLSLLSESSE
jgi:SNF2 family DNA or RNA helicase